MAGQAESTELPFFVRSGDPRGIGFAFHRAGTDRTKELIPSGLFLFEALVVTEIIFISRYIMLLYGSFLR